MFVFFHCNRWSPWFQVKHLNLLQEGKVGVQQGACFLPLSLPYAVVRALVSFFNLASTTHPTPPSPHPPAAGSSQAPFDSDCMSLSTPHSQERSLIGLAWVSCSLLNPSTVAREFGHCNRWSQSESFIWRGRKSINPKVGV